MQQKLLSMDHLEILRLKKSYDKKITLKVQHKSASVILVVAVYNISLYLEVLLLFIYFYRSKK